MNASTQGRLLLCIAGLMMLDATIGGAVGSHLLTNLDERSLRSFDTAVEFEFFNALGLIALAPYGGVALMVAWLAFAIGVWMRRASAEPSAQRSASGRG